MRLLEELDTLGLHVPADAVARGLETVRWRARLEHVRLADGRTLLLDAAHNPAGAAALASYLREVWPEGVVLVFGAMADKDIDGMLAALAPAAREIIVTQVDGARAAPIDALAAARARALHAAVIGARHRGSASRHRHGAGRRAGGLRGRVDFPARGRPARVLAVDRGWLVARPFCRDIPPKLDFMPANLCGHTNSMTRRDSWRIAAFAVLLPLVILASAAPAGAQALPGIKFSSQARAEQVGPNHYRLTGNVEGELERENLKFAADQVDYYTDTRRLIGTGHVVVITADSHISADKADINTRTRTGVFYNAFGTVTVTEESGSRSMFGTQEPIAYFYGERIERLSADKYKITKGGFTTCVQPTPRWEAVTSTTTMRVDKYALLKNAVLKVKNVPLFYLPAM